MKEYTSLNNNVSSSKFGVGSGISSNSAVKPQGLLCFSACKSKCSSRCSSNCGSSCASRCSSQCSSSCWTLCSGGADDTLEKFYDKVNEIIL